MIKANVIHSQFLSGFKKLLFLRLSCIYPKMADRRIVEEALLTSKLEEINEPDAIAKIAGIKMCESYARQYQASHCLDYRSVMPTNLYNVRHNHDPLNRTYCSGLSKPDFPRLIALALSVTNSSWGGDFVFWSLT